MKDFNYKTEYSFEIERALLTRRLASSSLQVSSEAQRDLEKLEEAYKKFKEGKQCNS